MHRRPLGRGRTIAAVGGIAIVIGCLLPWWRLGGNGELPLAQGNGLEGSGIAVFLVGLAVLALVALPYAAGDRPLGIDRPLAFGILAVAGWIAFGLNVVSLFLMDAFRFTEPIQVLTNGPGLWLTAIGLAILARAVYEMVREPAYR